MIKTIDHIINIDLVPKININQSINIKKNDTNSHKFIINIFNCNIPYDLTGLTSKIYFKKADNTKVFSDCTIDNALSGKVSFLLKTQTVSCVGTVETEVTIYGSDGEILTSVAFNFKVLNSIRDDNAIESTSEFTALTTALNAINKAVTSVPTIDALNVALQKNIANGNILDSNLKSDIAIGNATDSALKASIVTSNTTDTNLKASIVTSNTTDTNLKASIVNGNTLDVKLKASTATATTLDTSLKSDIANGNTTDTNLKASIVNGNILEASLKNDIANGNITDTNLKNDIAIAKSSIFTTEILDARNGMPSLDSRLDNIESTSSAQYADTTTKNNFLDQLKLKFIYGVKGDGIVDDTVAIQNAIDGVTSQNGVIYFPIGRYRITGVINLKPNVKLIGAGRKLSILVGVTESMTIVQSIQSTLTRTYNEIKDLGFEASADNVTAIKTALSCALLFENLYFAGLLYNFNINRGSNFQIKNILVEGTIARSSGKSIFQDTTKADYIYDIQISDYQIRNIGNGVATPSIEFNRAVGSFITGYHANDLGLADGVLYSGDCQGCKITTSIIVKPTNYAIKYILEGDKYPIAMSITDVDIDQVKLNGIQIDAGFWYTIVGGNITSVGQHGIVIGTNNVIVQGVRIVHCLAQGIQIEPNMKNFTIIGNHIEQTGAGILVSSGNSDNYIIQNNDLATLNSVKIIDNGTGVNKLIGNNLGVNTSYKKEYSISTVLTLKGGTTKETFGIDIPAGLFAAKPDIGFLIESNPLSQYLIGFYMFDNVLNSSTKAYFEIVRRDGTILSAGGTRFNVLLKS